VPTRAPGEPLFRLGVIGAGGHGTRYLRHARADVPGMTATALCRRDGAAGAALAAELGCRYHADPAALIADPEVDGIVVCTPPSSHLELAAAVLRAGKPLLLEKPLTGTLAEARELVRLDDAATAAGAAPPLMLAQTLRWNPVVARARELWPRLGPVRLVRLAQRLEPTRLAWQRDPAVSVGGSVLLTGVHVIDLARFLTGREFARVDSRQRRWLNPALEDCFLARAELDDGAFVSLEVSKYTQSRAGLLEAVGEAGQLRADYQDGGIRLQRGREREEIAVSAAVPTLPAVLAAWLTALRAARPAASSPATAALGGVGPSASPACPAVPVTARDGLRTLEIVEACYRSARERREVAIAELA
jgi:predicted dehydrogenase